MPKSIKSYNNEFYKRIEKETGLLLKPGMTPHQSQVQAITGAIYKIHYKYMCNKPGCKIIANVYANAELDFRHYVEELEYSETFLDKSVLVTCGKTKSIGAVARLWTESIIDRIFVKDVWVELARDEIENFNSKKYYKAIGDKRPLVMIMFTNQSRSPLATQFYKYLSKNSNIPDFVIYSNPNSSIEDAIKKVGKRPDYIIIGSGRNNAVWHKSMMYVANRGIKVIFQISDAQCLMPRINKWEHMITHLFGHSQKDWMGYQTLFKHLGPKVKFLYTPWGINTNIYKDEKLERDIDVSMICSVGKTWQYHINRRKFKEIVQNLDLPKGKKIVGSYYGKEYRNYLNRSKIFIVDASGRNAMVQKYIEGPACGAMLMGEKPTDPDDLFEDGVSFVEATPANLKKKIEYYLSHEDERKRIALEGQKRILQYHDIKMSASILIDSIMEDYNEKRITSQRLQI